MRAPVQLDPSSRRVPLRAPRSILARLGVVATLGGLALSTACVMPDDVAQMQKDLADVRQQLRRAQDEQSANEERLAALESRTAERPDQVTLDDLAELRVEVERAARQAEIASQRLNDVDLRIDRVAQEARRPRQSGPLAAGPRPGTADSFPVEPGPLGRGATEPGRGTPAADPLQAQPDPDSLYNTAYADFSKGNFSLAISGFEEYQQRYGDSPLADNALYWIGECHFSQGNFSQAIASFDELLGAYPGSDKAAAGNLKKALAYLEQNQIGKAIVQLRFVISSFPSSDEAKIARDKLASLGAQV